ncbi:beta-lactamase family protein [Sneathiella marina]|uniref:Beta-lactamase family protein n=1 Tax=Sneathiella marina TaxID=2950108 RepID=A0ABY4W5T3_9PROT|nr:serine hydrolase domain-containing protein [Sneathiella marina]USG62548.1 beta-lactamase family protein [Sneathiella marina]
MKIRIYVAFLALFTFTSPGFATDITPPDAVGLSPEKLGLMDINLQEDVDNGTISGATVAVMRHGKLVYQKAFGTRGRGAAPGPLKTDDIFRIYSMSKPITTVGIMMLMEQGRIQLTDPVSKFLPAFAETKVMELGDLYAPDNPITISDLLRHTSGIVYGFFGDTEVRAEYQKVDLYDAGQTTAEMVGKLAALPLEHQPGDAWEYSHSTDVLGRVIEVVSGKKLDQFFKSEILGPLGMNDTAFYVDEEEKARIVEPQFKGLLDPLNVPILHSGGGGLMSTADDYLIFSSMMLNGGIYEGKRLLKEETVAQMTQDQLGDVRPGNYDLLTDENGFGFGFAVRLSDEGFAAGSKGSYWWGGYAGTYFWIDPAEELIIVFMIQQPDQRSLYRPKIRNWVYNAIVN